MNAAHTIRAHDLVRVKAGKLAGLVGNVLDTRERSVLVNIEGVKDGESVSARQWIPVARLESVA